VGEGRRGISGSRNARRCRPPAQPRRRPLCPAAALAISLRRQGAPRAGCFTAAPQAVRESRGAGAHRLLPGYVLARSQAVLLELPASRSLLRSCRCRVLPGTSPVPLASVVQQLMGETLEEFGANTSVSTELIFWGDCILARECRNFTQQAKSRWPHPRKHVPL